MLNPFKWQWMWGLAEYGEWHGWRPIRFWTWFIAKCDKANGYELDYERHNPIAAQLERQLEAAELQLLKVSDQLLFYAANHRAKDPPQPEKAQVNVDLAQECIAKVRVATLNNYEVSKRLGINTQSP